MKALGIGLLIWLATIATALLAGYIRFKDSSVIASWPMTSGRVEVSEVTKLGFHYWPKLRYSYDVAGVTYQGRNIDWRDVSGSDIETGSRDTEGPAHRLAPYRLGSQVTVHYDPAKPSRSVVDARSLNYWQAVPFWGFMLQLFGAFFCIRQIMVMRKTWAFVLAMIGLFVLWVTYFISAAPT